MRLIDADALPKQKFLEANGNGMYEDVEIVYGIDIDNAPTIDAVPVVRCKDCKWWDYSEDEYSICCHPHYDIISVSRDGAGYCSFAERKSDE